MISYEKLVLKLKENDAYSEVLISFKLNIKVMFKFI